MRGDTLRLFFSYPLRFPPGVIQRREVSVQHRLGEQHGVGQSVLAEPLRGGENARIVPFREHDALPVPPGLAFQLLEQIPSRGR